MAPPDLSPAGHDMLFDLHELKILARQHGATQAEVLGIELHHLAVTIVSMADDEAGQQQTLTFVLETLPGLVYQLQQSARWRQAARGCLDE